MHKLFNKLWLKLSQGLKLVQNKLSILLKNWPNLFKPQPIIIIHGLFYPI